MAHSILKRGATGLAAAATAGALVLAVPGVAQAQEYETGNADRERSARDGSGDAEAHARANDEGRMRVFAEAKGGEAANPLPGGGTSAPTRADANTSLTRRVSVAEGTYKVVVHYRDARGFDRERGSNSDADVKRRSIVRFISQTGGGDRMVKRSQELPGRESNRRTTLFIEVPNDSSGFLKITGSLDASSRAEGNRSFGSAGARVSDVSFTVNRVR